MELEIFDRKSQHTYINANTGRSFYECDHRYYNEEYGIFMCDLCNGTCAYGRGFRFEVPECKKYDTNKKIRRG